jgi:hypothetical protein
MIFQEGTLHGYFRLDGVNYPKNNFAFSYEKDITDRTGNEINFSLQNIYDKRFLVNSRNILEVQGVAADDLKEAIVRLEESLSYMIVPYFVTKIEMSSIYEVFPYFENSLKIEENENN